MKMTLEEAESRRNEPPPAGYSCWRQGLVRTLTSMTITRDPASPEQSHGGRRRRGRPSVEANARLTGSTAAVLFVLLAAEGFTILQVRSLLAAHVFIGVLLVPPVLLKIGTTSYRFVRYNLGSPEYRRKGPPPHCYVSWGPSSWSSHCSCWAVASPCFWCHVRNGQRSCGYTKPASSCGSAPWRSMCLATWSIPPSWRRRIGCTELVVMSAGPDCANGCLFRASPPGPCSGSFSSDRCDRGCCCRQPRTGQRPSPPHRRPVPRRAALGRRRQRRVPSRPSRLPLPPWRRCPGRRLRPPPPRSLVR